MGPPQRLGYYFASHEDAVPSWTTRLSVASVSSCEMERTEDSSNGSGFKYFNHLREQHRERTVPYCFCLVALMTRSATAASSGGLK
jgi:hypothetical protein